MREIKKKHRLVWSVATAALLSAGVVFQAISQPAPGTLSPGRKAIDVRKAVFTLIASNFQLTGGILKGTTPYDAAAEQKAVGRVAFLSDFLNDAFPDISNLGDPETKAKADIWTNRAVFDKKLKDFQAHASALQQVTATETSASDAFKTAANAVAQDCKSCHDDFRAK
jgi:cytochrome c556